MSPSAPPPRGLTLVEIMAALALLSLVIGASSAWTVGAVRAERDAIRAAGGEQSLDRALRLLTRDIEEALIAPGLTGRDKAPVRFDVEQDEIVVVRPGDGALDDPGWRRVTWRRAETGELVRESEADADAGNHSASLARVALRGVERFDVTSVDPPADALPLNGAHRYARRSEAKKPPIAFDLFVEWRDPDSLRRLRWEVVR